MSPFLFVLCLEYLSRSLNQLKDSRDFNFHPRCQGLNITHLAFADDLILFSRGDVASVQLMLDKLGSFGEGKSACRNPIYLQQVFQGKILRLSKISLALLRAGSLSDI